MAIQKRIANEFTVAEANKLKIEINEHFKGTNILIDWKAGTILQARNMAVIGHVGVSEILNGRIYASDVTGDSDELICSFIRD